METKTLRRSRSRSRSGEKSRRRVRSPEDRHARNRSPVKGYRRRGRSDSDGSRSSGSSAEPSRHRGQESGRSSDSDRDHRHRRARSHGGSKDGHSSSGDNQKKHKTKKKHKDEKSSRRRSSSSESSVERNRSRDGRRRQSRSLSRERRREGSSRNSKERDRDRRRRSESRSSSSSSSSADSDQAGKTTQGASSAKEDKKKQWEMMKALETPEEKRARRLAKKEAKERKKREKMGWSEEYMGYTNADNPFGDNNLLGTFKWQKALEKKGIGHLSETNLKERNKHIQQENRRELQKVKQLRLEREREKSMREQELEMLQREKEAEHFKTWAEQEDNFHLQQAKLRSKIRIRDGRAKPIDLLAKYISAEDDDLSVEMHEPYTFLNGLTATDMDDLLEDIKVYMELEQGKNVDFWREMTTITEDEISKLRKLEVSGKGPGDRREGINTSVSTDVQSVFKGKTYSQLQALYMNIENKIQAGGSNLDVGYWESLLQQVRVYMARARLRERHQDVLRQKLYKLKQEQGVESEPLFPIIKEENETERPITRAAESADEEAGSSQQGDDRDRRTKRLDGEKGERSGRSSPEERKEGEEEEEGEKDEASEAVLTEEDLIQQSQAEYDSGRYSPTLLQSSELPLDTHVINVEEDLQRLVLARTQLQVTGDASESAEDAFIRRAKEGMAGDEAQFSVEMPLTGKMYLWADKYRPRKPRFFNRVHTGFEWNKYNQTHYDFDNPPPKIVQGYKFNIFYPDLIDKRSTPQYFLEPCPDNKDFGMLRFHAGPPYEDIAFKIVNREWEYSHRHGFRCQFANGIFQLWFHFKRYRYRR
ncbi:splicing factor Cactin-like isoform X2 [Carassius carassius]|uniref:splicing factor Cactin-like isoform X2 n=1 Tax=Carassius carassius TaxID=217509 RepID=UPI002869696F|nr:splicing factor Cactin-like isoform X2 [Carassius carassius]